MDGGEDCHRGSRSLATRSFHDFRAISKLLLQCGMDWERARA
jgi:hypothetical protein